MAKMADRQKFIIRTCCNHKTEYVFLSELSFEKYMDECTLVWNLSFIRKKKQSFSIALINRYQSFQDVERPEKNRENYWR